MSNFLHIDFFILLDFFKFTLQKNSSENLHKGFSSISFFDFASAKDRY